MVTIIILLSLPIFFWVFGWLLIDQFRSSATSANGSKGILMGAFGVGSSVTLIFLGTVGDPRLAREIDKGWSLLWEWLGAEQLFFAQWSVSSIYMDTMPGWWQNIMQNWLANLGVPLFDIFSSILIFAVMCLLFCYQLLSNEAEEAEVTLFGVFLLPIGIILILLAGGDNND